VVFSGEKTLASSAKKTLAAIGLNGFQFLTKKLSRLELTDDVDYDLDFIMEVISEKMPAYLDDFVVFLVFDGN